MKEEILAMAKEISRCAEEDTAMLQRLCEAAEAELAGKLKSGLKAEDCEGAFVCACAWLAAAGMECAAGHEAESFRVGELSVKRGGASDRAALLRRSARLLMQPYCEEETFCFRSVGP